LIQYTQSWSDKTKANKMATLCQGHSLRRGVAAPVFIGGFFNDYNGNFPGPTFRTVMADVYDWYDGERVHAQGRCDLDWRYCRRAERRVFIQVKGAAASAVRWVASVRTVEVTL